MQALTDRKRGREGEPTTAAIQPCSRTQEKLDELRAQIKKGELDEKDYFFTNIPGTKKHPPRNDLDDDQVRCLQCGYTIAEHISVAVGAVPPTTWTNVLPLAIQNATEVPLAEGVRSIMRVLRIGDGQRWLVESEDTLYERVHVTDALWSAFENARSPAGANHIIVLGHPGIGKSVGLINSILRRLLKETQMVVVVTVADVNIFTIDGLHTSFDKIAFPMWARAVEMIIREVLKGALVEHLWVLYDIKQDCMFDASLLALSRHCNRLHVALFSSPQYRNYHIPEQRLAGSGKCRRFYVPVWAFEELKVIRPGVTEQAYFDVGGVPRHIEVGGENMGEATREALIEQEIFLRTFEYSDLAQPTDKFLASSNVLCPIPTPDYSSVKCMEFVSRRAAWSFVERQDAKVLSGMRTSVMGRLKNSQARQGALGFEVEVLFLYDLRNRIRSSFEMTALPPSGSGAQQQSTAVVSLKVPQRAVTFDRLALIGPTKALTLFTPNSSNFPCFDAFLVEGTEVTALQVTLAAEHKPNQFGLWEIKNAFDAQNPRLTLERIVWVTDTESALLKAQPIGDRPTERQQKATNLAAFPKEEVKAWYDRAEQFVLRYSPDPLGV